MTRPLKNKKQFEQGLNIALRYISYQPRTIYETTLRLENKAFDAEIIKQIIQYLQDHNFLNDMNFVRLFIESKEKYKPRSKFAFRYALKKKGISAHIIDNVLEKYDDEDLAKKAIELKLNTWRNFDAEKFKKKAINHLRYRGFSFDICLSTIEYFLKHLDAG